MSTASRTRSTQPTYRDRQNPFGAASLEGEPAYGATMPEAVRRCRWIAVDINATEFSLFLIGPSLDHSRLVTCFDNEFPLASVQSRLISTQFGESIVKHADASTAPLWWSGNPQSASFATFERLTWATQTAPVLPGTSGIAFPVYAERGQCGLAVFTGPDIVIDDTTLPQTHGRCFALFAGVTGLRPIDTKKAPTISKRELECLRLTANGYTSDAIASLLGLSVHTTNQYMTNATQKLDAVNRMHAVAKALRMGLID